MYMQDGKPIDIPIGRRNPTITRMEFEQLSARVSELEKKIAEKPETEPAVDEPKDDLDALKAEAAELGIEIKGNWGAKKIKAAIAEKRGEA